MLDFLWPVTTRTGISPRPLPESYSSCASLCTSSALEDNTCNLKRKRQDTGGRCCAASEQHHTDPSCLRNHQCHRKQVVPPDDSLSKSHSIFPASTDMVEAKLSEATSINLTPIQWTEPSTSHSRNTPQKLRRIPLQTSLTTSTHNIVDVTTQIMQQNIESQFNLEIILKHRELRLIDQEIAKCEISLEQLRRCATIPAFQTPDLGHDELGVSKCLQSSPWKSINSPYARHYQQWLLPESAPEFTSAQSTSQSSSFLLPSKPPERSTRSVRDDRVAVDAQCRVGRQSLSTRNNVSLQPCTETKGPMIVKRASDGQVVKLVCIDCQRSNFNSVQGFINHCRIAHARQFVSHDAAIEASGEDFDASKNLGGCNPGSHQPSNVQAGSLVHPFINTAKPLPKLEDAGLHIDSQEASQIRHSWAKHVSAPVSQGSNTSAVVKCAPYLATIFARRGSNLDLNAIVTDATTRMESEIGDELDEDESSDAESHILDDKLRSSGKQKQHHPLDVRIPHSHANHVNRVKSNYGARESAILQNTDMLLAPSLTSDDGDLENTHSESGLSTHSVKATDDRHFTLHIHNEGVELIGETNGVGEISTEAKFGEHQSSDLPAPKSDHSPSSSHQPTPREQSLKLNPKTGPSQVKRNKHLNASELLSRNMAKPAHNSSSISPIKRRVRKPSIKAAEAATINQT